MVTEVSEVEGGGMLVPPECEPFIEKVLAAGGPVYTSPPVLLYLVDPKAAQVAESEVGDA